MAIEEIPRSFKYTCDRCEAVHIQPNASGHYTDSRPDGWARLRMSPGKFDKTFEYLLCQVCSAGMIDAINRAMTVANPPKVV